MVKRILVYGVVALFLIPIILAYQTDISVQTKPNELVIVKIYDSKTDNELFYDFNRANSNGLYTKTVSTGVKEIDVYIRSQDMKNVYIGTPWEAKSYEAGVPININFLEEKKNETTTETNTTANVSVENSSNENEFIGDTSTTSEEDNKKVTGTGKTIVGNLTSGKTIYYIIGLVIVMAIAFVSLNLVKKGRGRTYINENPKAKEIKVKNLSTVLAEQKQMRESMLNAERASENDIGSIEKKLREAQLELNKLKNADKIKAVEAEIAKRQEELEKMKRGEI